MMTGGSIAGVKNFRSGREKSHDRLVRTLAIKPHACGALLRGFGA